MHTNTKLVLGGIAGVCVAVGMAAGLIACADAPSQPRAAEPERAAPVPSPNLEAELATTAPPRVDPPAPAEPEVDPFEPELDATGAIRVRRLIVATGVSHREPTGAADTLELGAQRRVYAFVEAVNETGEDVALRVTFEPEQGESAGHVALDVPARASRWRTWAYTRNVNQPGRWEAVVRAPDGRVIARRAFDVVE